MSLVPLKSLQPGDKFECSSHGWGCDKTFLVVATNNDDGILYTTGKRHVLGIETSEMWEISDNILVTVLPPQWDKDERQALEKLCRDKELSERNLLRQALRIYQLFNIKSQTHLVQFINKETGLPDHEMIH